MSSTGTLSKYLYDAAHGDMKTALATINHATVAVTIATPASGKKIAILYMAVMPSTVDNLADISWWVGAAETAIFVDLHVNTVVAPIMLNLESCPIIGPADGILKAVNSGAGSEVYITVNYVELT